MDLGLGLDIGMNYGPIQNLMGREFFSYALPWLLTFAIVYGILDHYEIPGNKSTRAVISLSIAFLVLPVAVPVMAVLTKMGLSLVIIFCGLLFFLILLEMTETRHVDKEGEETKIIEKHTKTFGLIVIIIAFLVFVGSGGTKLLGIDIPRINGPLLFFLGVMALAVWWMAFHED